jgi:uncharacterized protein YukE
MGFLNMLAGWFKAKARVLVFTAAASTALSAAAYQAHQMTKPFAPIERKLNKSIKRIGDIKTKLEQAETLLAHADRSASEGKTKEARYDYETALDLFEDVKKDLMDPEWVVYDGDVLEIGKQEKKSSPENIAQIEQEMQSVLAPLKDFWANWNGLHGAVERRIVEVALKKRKLYKR